MIVECPNCQTKFNLPDEKVGPEGAKVRCSVCKTVFSVEPPEPDDFPGFGESGAKPVWATEEEERPEREREGEGEPEAERMRDRFEDLRPSTADFDDLGLTKPKKFKLSKMGKILALVGLLVVMLGGAYGTAAYFLEIWPFSKKPVKSAMEQPIPAEVQHGPAAQQAQAPALPSMEQRLENLPIVDFTQYLVDNPKIGKLYVIEGAVVNKNATDVGWVKVEASLTNDKGEVILTKEIDAGPKVPNYELKFLNKNDLDARLSSKQDILLNNGDVKPGEKIPFMVVFENIPPETKEYSLRVTSFQDVAPPAAGSSQGAPSSPKPASAPAQHSEGK